MAHLTQRILTPEIMDEDDVPVEKLRRSLGFIRWVNRRLGGTRAVMGHLRRWSKRWPRCETIRILDVATGSADIPLAIARWAARERRDVRIVAIDRHERTLALAREHLGAQPDAGDVLPRITLLRADARYPPFAPNSFDYCVTSMFLHHLPDIEVLTVLRLMDRLATRGLIWNDLIRNRRAYLWCKLLTLFGDDIVRHDGPVSVLAGFKRHEVLDFRERLTLEHTRYFKHAFHRFTLAGER